MNEDITSGVSDNEIIVNDTAGTKDTLEELATRVEKLSTKSENALSRVNRLAKELNAQKTLVYLGFIIVLVMIAGIVITLMWDTHAQINEQNKTLIELNEKLNK